MKIVINAFAARVGGGQTYLKNLLGRLPEDPDLSILVFAPHNLALPEDPRVRRGRTAMPVTNPILRLFWERFQLPREIRKFGADILFCPAGLINARVPADCRTVTMFRNMLPFDEMALAQLEPGLQKMRNRLLKPQMLRSMAEADLTIFISDFARARIERDITPRQAVTIPHGVNEAFMTAGTDCPRPQETGSRPYVLYVSRFEPYKHHDEVVRAWAALPASLRESHSLLLVGENDFEAGRRVRDFIDREGLADTINIVGPIAYERLPAFYNNAEAILFASSCENCPNILLESLGAGVAIICSDVAPMPEFGGMDLIYFSPYQPDDIAAKLEMVLSDPALARKLGADAARRAGDFEWNRTATATWSAIYAIGERQSAT